jgi:hypothetical protein
MAATLLATAAAGSSAATNTITVTLGAAPNAGDKLIAFVHHTDDFPATPSGWTKDKEVVTVGVLTCFSKTASGSEGTGLTFTAPTNGGMTARVLRYVGLGSLHTTASGNSTGTGTFDSGFLTTSTADVLLIGGAGLHSNTLPTGDVTPGGSFTSVAADARSTNSTSRKSLLTVATATAATAGTYQFTGTYSPAALTNCEPALVAWTQVDPNGSVTAVVATASAQGRVPTVGASANGSVAAVRAQATAQFEAPVASGETTVSGGGAAAASAQMTAPVVTGNGNVSVTAVRMIATALASAPSIPASVTAVAATASALLRAPAVSGGVVNGSIVAVVAQATVTARIPGVGVVETLPSNTSTGRVTARFATAEVLVGDNDGVPNVFPITDATITFTSTASVLLNATATPAPIVIMPKPIVCTLDSQGYLVDSAGHRWCDLIATDDTDLTPSTRRWKVTFSGIAISDFDMTVPGGTTFDLTTKIPT